MRPTVPATFMIVITVLGGAAGLLYSVLTKGQSLLGSIVHGSFIAIAVTVFERGLIFRSAQERMRRWPTLIYVPVSEAIYVVLVTIGFGVGGLVNWSTGLTREPFLDAILLSFQILVYALLVSGVLVFVTRVRDLLGHSVFANLILGRYHRPVEEHRIFLFIDLVGSTAYARTHGDLRAQGYLAAIFAAMAEPVRLHGGAIDDYIGDMALITWPEARGLRDADCIRCVFAVLDEFKRDPARWQRDFGQVPSFRAALHGGAIVTAEVGIDRHKISYFGDVVNTTARIETLCRDLDASVLISAELLGRCQALPGSIQARSFGNHLLRGLDQELEVFALEQTDMPRAFRAPSRAWTGQAAEAAARG